MSCDTSKYKDRRNQGEGDIGDVQTEHVHDLRQIILFVFRVFRYGAVEENITSLNIFMIIFKYTTLASKIYILCLFLNTIILPWQQESKI